MVRYGFSFALLTLLILPGCSAKNSPAVAENPGHELHAMEGIIRHVGPEIALYAGPDKPTKVIFPREVRFAHLEDDARIRVARAGNTLLFYQKTGLEREGEPVVLTSVDGRQYEFRVFPESAKDSSHSFAVGSARAKRSQSSEEPLARLKTVRTNGPSESRSLLRRLRAVSSTGNLNIPGYHNLEGERGELLATQRTHRIVIEEAFVGAELSGYIVSVENLTRRALPINANTVRVVLNLKRFAFECDSLGAREASDLIDDARPHSCRGYLVTGP